MQRIGNPPIVLAEKAVNTCSRILIESTSRGVPYQLGVHVLLVSSAFIVVPLALIQTTAFASLRLIALLFGKSSFRDSLASSVRALTYFFKNSEEKPVAQQRAIQEVGSHNPP